MKRRILRLDLDELNSLAHECRDPEDLADFLRGFWSGLNTQASERVENPSTHWERGKSFGIRVRLGEGAAPVRRSMETVILGEFSEDILQAVRELMGRWPKARKDGGMVDISPVLLADRLVALAKTHDIQLLLMAAGLYLNSKPEWPRDPHHFFGIKPVADTGRPPYWPWVQAAAHNRCRAGGVSA